MPATQREALMHANMTAEVHLLVRMMAGFMFMASFRGVLDVRGHLNMVSIQMLQCYEAGLCRQF